MLAGLVVVSCEFGSWSAWSDCDKPCDVGRKWRTKSVTFPEKQMEFMSEPPEIACSPPREETPCLIKRCGLDDCTMSSWSGWSTCTSECGGGTQERRRSILQGNNESCGATTEVQECNTISCSDHLKNVASQHKTGLFTVTLAGGLLAAGATAGGTWLASQMRHHDRLGNDLGFED